MAGWVLALTVSLGSATVPVQVPVSNEKECHARGAYAATLGAKTKKMKIKWSCSFKMPEHEPNPEFPFDNGQASGSTGSDS